MADRYITLHESESGKNYHRLDARLSAEGDVVIEGQDLGEIVEAFWGYPEYEWDITIRAANVPLLVAALSGVAGDDVLSLLAARCAVDERAASKTFLEERGVPIEFWSRAGD